MPLKKGATGFAVVELQNALLRLDCDLPRWGADGNLGDESLNAAHDYLVKMIGPSAIDADKSSLSDSEIKLIMDKASAANSEDLPNGYQDERKTHPIPRANLVKVREYSKIDAIVLHQTACPMSEKADRWYSVPIHIGITRMGKVLHLGDFSYNFPHANSFNSRSIGIEIEGAFAGIEGDAKTFWKPTGSKMQPMTLTEWQISATRSAVKWICDEVAKHGGKIKYIFAHRQSSADRRSDPGSLVWQEIGVWAQDNLGLSDGGEGFTSGDGYPLPKQWDSKRKANY